MYLNASLVYFMVDLVVGLWLAFGAGGGFIFIPAGLTPLYFHLLMFGWITQLIIGVAYWMFPVFSRAQPHGGEMLAWVTFMLINCGLVLRAVGEPLNEVYPGAIWGWVLLLSAILQCLAGLGFAVNTWPRIKER